MKGFNGNIEKLTEENDFFRKVIFTGRYEQLVLMSLLPKEEIGDEVHETTDQFFRFEKGEGKVIIDGEEVLVGADDVVIVPAGSRHNVINTSDTEKLKLYTIYSPPHHKDQTVHKTRMDAMADEEDHL
ncbi:cupin domain-containing protein [Patescibacteria group bacterium]|nr:cupin domain-containing protein [Patescibacteria group bacterium]